MAEVLRARLPTAPEEEQEEASGQPPGTPGALGAGVNRLADDEEPWEGTRFEITTLDDILDQVRTCSGCSTSSAWWCS